MLSMYHNFNSMPSVCVVTNTYTTQYMYTKHNKQHNTKTRTQHKHTHTHSIEIKSSVYMSSNRAVKCYEKI